MTRKIEVAGTGLVVSYCFPPYADTAAVIAAKRVREIGLPVRVVSNAMDRIRTQDPGLLSIAGPLVLETEALPTRTAFSSWRSIEEFCQASVDQVSKWQSSGESFGWMYSRAQFAASTMAAAMVKLDNPDLPWVAEFSDPLSRDVSGDVRTSPVQEGSHLAERLVNVLTSHGFTVSDPTNGLELCEAAAYAFADQIIFTNSHQRDYMMSYLVDSRLRERAVERALVSPHPTLPPEFYDLGSPSYEIPQDRTNLAYFGNLYKNRSLDSILEALRMLPEAARERLCFHVFTSKPADVEVAARARGISESVRVNATVPYLDFLTLANSMDILVVNDVPTRLDGLPVNPYLPSKVSDYRGARAATWAMVEEGSTMDALDFTHKTPVQHATAAMVELARIAVGR